MKKKQPSAKGSIGKGRPVGFWDRSDPHAPIVSVHLSSSRFSKSMAFLRRIVGRVLKRG